jgi:hypothetical protein
MSRGCVSWVVPAKAASNRARSRSSSTSTTPHISCSLFNYREELGTETGPRVWWSRPHRGFERVTGCALWASPQPALACSRLGDCSRQDVESVHRGLGAVGESLSGPLHQTFPLLILTPGNRPAATTLSRFPTHFSRASGRASYFTTPSRLKADLRGRAALVAAPRESWPGPSRVRSSEPR